MFVSAYGHLDDMELFARGISVESLNHPVFSLKPSVATSFMWDWHKHVFHSASSTIQAVSLSDDTYISSNIVIHPLKKLCYETGRFIAVSIKECLAQLIYLMF
jgi:hypothetical protein